MCVMSQLDRAVVELKTPKSLFFHRRESAKACAHADHVVQSVLVAVTERFEATPRKSAYFQELKGRFDTRERLFSAVYQYTHRSVHCAVVHAHVYHRLASISHVLLAAFNASGTKAGLPESYFLNVFIKIELRLR